MMTRRNRTRIAFLLALALAPPAAAQTLKPGCMPIPGSSGLFAPGKVILLGELHGTKESPAFAASVVCNAVAADLDVIVGLELSGSAQPDVDAYLGSTGAGSDRQRLLNHPLWQRDYQDGRTSRAMFKLIDDVRQLGRKGSPVKIVMFDASGGRGGQQRDRDMAAKLMQSMEAAPRAIHVVLTGNLHSRVFPGVPRNSEYEPMGYILTKALASGRVVSLDVAYAGGTAWVCNPDCGISELGSRKEGPPGAIEMEEKTRPAGHAGWYFVGSIAASPPAAGDFCRSELKLQESMLLSDYTAFDQTMGEGWRRLAEVQCQPEAAQLIDQFLAQNNDLTPGERRNLQFHAGQVLALEGERATAIAHFQQAINNGEAEDSSFKWNAYVRATLAFLRGDRGELSRQREIVAQSAPRRGRVPNLHIVDSLLEHMGQSYRVAYAAPASSSSKPKGTPESPPPVDYSASPTSAPPAKWLGHWQAYEYGTKSWTIRFEGRNFHAVLGVDDWYRGTIALRPEMEPAEIDFLIEDCRCSLVGRTSKAIFAWDGDVITLAAPSPGSPRPTVFDEKSGQIVRLERMEH